jgi:hypothetical protein
MKISSLLIFLSCSMAKGELQTVPLQDVSDGIVPAQALTERLAQEKKGFWRRVTAVASVFVALTAYDQLLQITEGAVYQKEQTKTSYSQEIIKKVGAMPLIHEEKEGDTEQVSLLPLERELVRAQQLFEALLRVAAIPPDIDVSFSILDKPHLIDAFFGGGCYEMALFAGHHTEIFQKPAISISSAALMLDSAREKPHLTAFLLAHEVAHLHKRLARKFYCSEERDIRPEQRRQEELEADQRGVEFLNALGYDGASTASKAIRAICDTVRYGCMLSPTPKYPSLAERFKAIH